MPRENIHSVYDKIKFNARDHKKLMRTMVRARN